MKGKLKLIIKLIAIYILLVLLAPSSNAFATENTIKIDYFGVEACLSCMKAEKHTDELIDKLKAKGIEVELYMHSTFEAEEEQLLVKYNNYFDIKEDKYKLIPAMFIGNVALVGYEEIEEKLESTITNFYNNPKEYKAIDVDNSSSKTTMNITTLGIFIAGLLDGINPCSIAMMLFFISFLFMTNDESSKSKIFTLGLSFAAGTFVAYLLLGIGLFKFIYAFSNIKFVMKGFYFALFVMGLYLASINVLDYINIKKGKEEMIRNQLSRGMKSRIHAIIKKYNNNYKLFYFTAFMTAFVISFLEFFCTGQIYLPVITYMINNSKNLEYIFLLVLYNIAFILPLLLITTLMHFGKEVIDISTVLVTKLHLIKLVGAFFFIGVSIYSMYQFLLM